MDGIAVNAPIIKIKKAIRLTASDLKIKPVNIVITPTTGKMMGK
jgi:hypothetical protein